jgi:hypothetical protein
MLVVSAAARPVRPAGSPAAFLAGVVRLLAANRYDGAWVSLNPVDQEAAPRQAYVDCESATPIPGTLESLRIVRVRREATVVAPERGPESSTAVTFALQIRGAGVVAPVRLTAHAVAVAGRWTWVLPLDRLQTYRNHLCPLPSGGNG